MLYQLSYLAAATQSSPGSRTVPRRGGRDAERDDHRGRARSRAGAARRRHGAVRHARGWARGSASESRVRGDGPRQCREPRAGGGRRPRRARAFSPADQNGVRAHRRARRGGSSAGAIPLVLGGDHSVALGTLGGFASVHGVGGVLWIDAHADANTPETSPSGNVHGMGLAAALGLAGAGFESDAWPLPAVDPRRVALVGTRELDEGERTLLREVGVRVFTMSEIDRIGIERAVREALDRVAGPGFVHVSLDMDVLDPVVAPGVGTPVRGGLTYREAHLASRARRGVAARRLARGRRGESDPRPREHDRADRRRARRERARQDDLLRLPGRAGVARARVTSSEPSAATYRASRRSAPARSARASAASSRASSVESICDRSPVAAHQSSSESACQCTGASSRASISSPAPSTSPRSSSGSARRNGPGARGSGRSMSSSSSAERPVAVSQSFASEAAQTAIAVRVPGRSTRAISANACAGSGTSMTPKRQRTPSTDSSGRSIADASSTRNSTFSMPSAAARRRAASSISGAASVESRSPSGSRRGAATKPVSPSPAASSSTVSPDAGSSSSTSRSVSSRVASRSSCARRSQPAATARHASTCSCSGVAMWPPARTAG